MPLALIGVAAIFIVVGFRGTQTCLFSLLQQDFTGSGNFLYFVVALVIVGAVGYIPKLKGVSDAFLALIILVIFLSNQGFWAQLQAALQTSTASPSTTTGSLSLPPVTGTTG